MEEETKDIIRKAAQAVGSLSETGNLNLMGKFRKQTGQETTGVAFSGSYGSEGH